MKKYSIILLVLITAMLTGCTNSGIVLTDEQNDIAAEYMAGLVLKYDNLYSDKLIYEKPTSSEDPITSPSSEVSVTASPMPTSDSGVSPDSLDSSNTTSTSTPVENNFVDIANIFSDTNVQLSYTDFQLYDSYPKESSSFQLSAEDGNKLFVVEFDIKNITDKKQQVNFIKDKIAYQLKINDAVYTAAVTPLTNDLQYLDMSINPNETKKALIVFEVLDQTNTDQISLYVTKSDQTALVSLK